MNEEWLLPFIYLPKRKAKFESDCVDYEGDKTAANLLSVSFKNLSDGAVVLSGLPPFKDEIGFYESWTSFCGVMAAGDRTESVRHVVEADIEVKQQRIYSACYNLGPFEVPLMTLLKITSNKHLRKPPVGQFHGFNSRLFCTRSSCTMKGLRVRKCVSGKKKCSFSELSSNLKWLNTKGTLKCSTWVMARKLCASCPVAPSVKSLRYCPQVYEYLQCGNSRCAHGNFIKKVVYENL